MIILSENTSKIGRKVAWLSLAILFFEFMPFKRFSFAGFSFEGSDPANVMVLVGALTLLLIFALAANIFSLVRDIIITRIEDELELANDEEFANISFEKIPVDQLTVLERNAGISSFFSWMIFLAQGVGTPILGIYTTTISWGNMLHFVQYITK